MKTTKKIALATAAALAIVGISASAQAAPLAVTVAGSANTTTSAAPATVAVPASNVIDSGHSVALAATADTNTVVTFTATGSVKLVSALNTTPAPVTTASGVTSASVTSQGSAVTEYAYTTSTSVGSVTITNGAYSTIVYIQGTAGSASNVAVSVPASSAINTAPTISVSATDVFGNAVGGETVSVTLIGATFSDLTVTKSLVTSTAANQNLIGDVDTNTGWSVRYNDSTLKFQFISETTGTPNISVSSTASATFGTSYHIMVTHDASAGANNSKIYLNGVLDNTATNPSSPVSGTVLKMGDIATGLMWLNNLTGLVYLVRIYNRVLSPNEVFQNFQASHWEIPHVKGTWAAAPSINAALTYAKIANLDNQWTDLGHDIGPVQATQIVATTTSRKQAGADFVCDGTADDVEIQAALDAANAVGGGTVMILDGTYNINAPINVYDNIILCGTGRGTILKSVNGGIEVPTATVIQNYDQNYGNSGIIIRDMTITGLSAADPLVYGIYLSACDEPPYVTISKVHFTGDTYYDIYLQACYHATIEGITGSGRGGVGQGSFLVYLNESAYCHVVNCQAYTENSIMFSNCSDCMVRSCSVTTHGGYAIEFANCDHCGAVGNEVAPDASGAPAVGIEDLNGVQNLIVANVVYKGTVAGINMDGTAQGDVIVGNSVNGCTGWGIGYGGGAGYANISYNNIIGTSKEAIRATAAPASVALYGAVVNGNVCYANNLNGLVL